VTVWSNEGGKKRDKRWEKYPTRSFPESQKNRTYGSVDRDARGKKKEKKRESGGGTYLRYTRTYVTIPYPLTAATRRGTKKGIMGSKKKKDIRDESLWG